MNPKMATQVFVVCTVVVFLFASQELRAQSADAVLSGTVTDRTGAIIANAKVSVKNVATGVTADTETDASGHYSVPALAAGDYTLILRGGDTSTVTEERATYYFRVE